MMNASRKRFRAAPGSASLALLLAALFAPAYALRLSDQPTSAASVVGREAFERRLREADLPSSIAHTSGKVHFDLLAKLLADDRRGTPQSVWLEQIRAEQPSFQVATQSHPLLGQPAPDFSLLDHQGRSWRLSKLTAAGPVALVFYLGYGCDACVHNLFELNADLARFRALGAQVVAISGDSSEVTCNRFARYGAFDFPTLCDADRQVAQAYGVFESTIEDKPGRSQHATLLIARGGVIHWVNFGDAPFRGNLALLFELRRAGERSSPFAAASEKSGQP